MNESLTEKRIYLDYAATAPLLPEVQEALLEYASLGYGNASSLYYEGREARKTLEQSRADSASRMGCLPHELYFCSGGTEAAGSLIEGIALGSLNKSGRRHIICAAFEHHAVLKSALSLKRFGFEVELLRPNREGFITPESLQVALKKDTLLVLVGLAQNEVGTVQNVAELARLSHAAGALIMSDCVQALGKLPFSLADISVDAACFSAHKIGGPFGVGAFYLRRGVTCRARQLGGGQEQQLRSGTQNVAGALGFAKAIKYHSPEYIAQENIRLAALRDELLVGLTQASSRISPTVSIASGSSTQHLSNVLHVLVQGIESQTMVLKLDELGFAVSGGSACSTGSLEPSHVLTSMGISKDEAYGALRVSLGRDTSNEDCQKFAEALLSIL